MSIYLVYKENENQDELFVRLREFIDFDKGIYSQYCQALNALSFFNIHNFDVKLIDSKVFIHDDSIGFDNYNIKEV